MPSKYIQSIADRTGKSISSLENQWDKAKTEALKVYKSSDKKYWGLVTNKFKEKLGESNLNESFLCERRKISSESKKTIKKIKKELKTSDFMKAASKFSMGMAFREFEKEFFKQWSRSSTVKDKKYAKDFYNVTEKIFGFNGNVNLQNEAIIVESVLEEQQLMESLVWEVFTRTILEPFRPIWEKVKNLFENQPEVFIAFMCIKWPKTAVWLLSLYIAITGPIGVLLSLVSKDIRDLLNKVDMQQIAYTIINMWEHVKMLLKTQEEPEPSPQTSYQSQAHGTKYNWKGKPTHESTIPNNFNRLLEELKT